MTGADLVVVGGGQAGLATAHVARQAGLEPVVLEASAEPAGSWPRYYDSLTLFSPARYAALPGLPFPGDPERYPARDEVADYLRDYAARLDADVRCGKRVVDVERDGDALVVVTADGDGLRAPVVVAASGGFGTPHVPMLPGLGAFAGEVLHSAAYRSPAAFAGKRVVVVGAGNSAVQIAADLATHAHVTLATRSPIAFRPQRPLGRDIHWWFEKTGLDTSRLGLRLLRGAATNVLDDGRYRAAIAAGNPDRRPLFTTLTSDGVVWADGSREEVDVLLLATGYRPNVAYLERLGALDAAGAPLHDGGVSTTVPGLGYVGLPFQRSHASATIRGVGRDAEHVLKRLLASAPRGRTPAPELAAAAA